MVGEYLIRCINTGEHIGEFKTIIHGSGECSNCGRNIMWLYVFSNKTRPALNITLGSECAKNVPKFSEAYSKFKLFQEKIKLYLQWQGKKLSELPVDHRITLEDLEHEIAEHQRKEQEERAKIQVQAQRVIDAQHRLLGTDFFQRLELLAQKNTFLASILSQSKGKLLSDKQIEVAKRVMSEVEPAVQAQEANKERYEKQVARLKKFVWIDTADWAGGRGWTHEYVKLGKVHRELLLSFCEQLKQGRLLSDKQENVIAKCETVYHKQLRLKVIIGEIQAIQKIQSRIVDINLDKGFVKLLDEYKEIAGKEYLTGVSPSNVKMPSDGVKP